MNDPIDAGGDVRLINRAIAAGYDAVILDPPADTRLDPDLIFGAACLYGCAKGLTRKFDVLDLGCGTGAQLENIATSTRGRLVGVDISRESCARTSARLARFGARAKVIHADALDLVATELGKADLILNLGVIFITPPPVRARIIEIIAACLKPGGVAVVSYYAGPLAHCVAELHANLRAAVDASDPPATRLATARSLLATIKNDHPVGIAEHQAMEWAIRHAAGSDDRYLFHEALNQEFNAIDTSALATEFEKRGLTFLTYLTTPGAGGPATGRQRAADAEAGDSSLGGYRHALFGRLDGDMEPDMRSRHVTYSSGLIRVGAPAAYRAAATYHDPKKGVTTLIEHEVTQAALDELANGARGFAHLVSAARRRLDQAGVTPAPDLPNKLSIGLKELWIGGLLAPVWSPG